MTWNNSFVYIILAVLVIENVWLKLIVLISGMVLFFKHFFNDFDKNSAVYDVVYCLMLFVISMGVNFNLDIINFVLLFVFNVLGNKFVKKIKKEIYFSIYFFVVLVSGVLFIC